MNDNEIIITISVAILEFSNAKEIIGFEKFVSAKLNGSKEIELFNKIWATTIDFEGWNHPNLMEGVEKTIEILKNKYNLSEQVCRILANQGAYEWK